MGLSQGALSGLGPKRGAGLYLATELRSWLDSVTEFVDENDATEDQPHTRLPGYTRIVEERDAALKKLRSRLPVFAYFNNYFRVRPNLYLSRFAGRVEQDLLNDDRYGYGNLCLLKLLGFEARELADLGDAPDPGDDQEAFDRYRSQLDERSIKLNAASVRLTSEIRSIWNSDRTRAEADTVLIQADGQYLKVVVEDELGVQIEVDQRSAGWTWPHGAPRPTTIPRQIASPTCPTSSSAHSWIGPNG